MSNTHLRGVAMKLNDFLSPKRKLVGADVVKARAALQEMHQLCLGTVLICSQKLTYIDACKNALPYLFKYM